MIRVWNRNFSHLLLFNLDKEQFFWQQSSVNFKLTESFGLNLTVLRAYNCVNSGENRRTITKIKGISSLLLSASTSTNSRCLEPNRSQRRIMWICQQTKSRRKFFGMHTILPWNMEMQVFSLNNTYFFSIILVTKTYQLSLKMILNSANSLGVSLDVTLRNTNI